MPLETPAPVNEVPVDAAYAAATERALKTTQALILAEAQVLALVRQVEEHRRRADVAEEAAKHAKQLLTRRTRTLQRRIDALTEVNHDGPSETDEADADGEAYTAHAFSD